MDVLTPEQRRKCMSAIRSRDTRPEVLLRSLLHRRGLRFRKNVAGMPGRPDIVLARWKAVVFVHGCFWHRHENCRFASIPKTRTEYWQAKLSRNIIRDRQVKAALQAGGWRVFTVRECELRTEAEAAANLLASLIRNAGTT